MMLRCYTLSVSSLILSANRPMSARIRKLREGESIKTNARHKLCGESGKVRAASTCMRELRLPLINQHLRSPSIFHPPSPILTTCNPISDQWTFLRFTTLSAIQCKAHTNRQDGARGDDDRVRLLPPVPPSITILTLSTTASTTPNPPATATMSPPAGTPKPTPPTSSSTAKPTPTPNPPSA